MWTKQQTPDAVAVMWNGEEVSPVATLIENSNEGCKIHIIIRDRFSNMGRCYVLIMEQPEGEWEGVKWNRRCYYMLDIMAIVHSVLKELPLL